MAEVFEGWEMDFMLSVIPVIFALSQSGWLSPR